MSTFLYSWNSGIMEEWNDGRIAKWLYVICVAHNVRKAGSDE